MIEGQAGGAAQQSTERGGELGTRVHPAEQAPQEIPKRAIIATAFAL